MSLSIVGTVLDDRYEILAFAGAGGMGHVYRARDRASDATVALKVLASTGDAQRFAREAGVLATLDHHGVVRHLGHGQTREGAQYIVMEWLAGEDLASRLDADGVLAVKDAILLARQVADALAAAHRAGVVHRDLKPANLFLVDRSFADVKLLDFGVARTAAATELTVTGTVVGTPPYMAPEQVRGDAIGPTADVYGLGAVLHRCLTGKPPFEGAHHLAILAKVILETPPAIREARPDVPPALDALVARLLAKDPAERPRDGEALAEELRTLDSNTLSSERRLRATVSAREKRVATVMLCSSGISDDETLQTSDADRIAHARDAARRAVEARGGSIASLTRGAWLVTIPSAAAAGEQAVCAARCALAFAAVRPGAPIFVATGRVLVAGEGRVGEVIDRASAALLGAREAPGNGGVRVDTATAELLGGRFRIEGDGNWRALVAEEEDVAPVRTLLGKPAPCVGRETQLAMLRAALGACADESRAGAALVSAPIGLGKTHLVRELLRGTETRADLDVLFAKGDPMRAASAFGLAGQILAHAAGVRDSDHAEARAVKLAALVERDFAHAEAPRMRELLGEICGIAVAPADASAEMRAARADLSVMADALRGAWTAWLAARAGRATLLVVLEDVHWADAASLRLMESATTTLSDRAVFVLATSRPEGATPFAERFRSVGLVELSLAPLSPSSAEKLVKRALGPTVSPELAQALVRRSGGHPFHLEELVRAVADGRGADALPDSVLGMVQARLDDLGADARRLLRAASVFGETFRAAGVLALMGVEMSEGNVRTVLAALVERELVTQERDAKWHGTATYSFRHVLFRDACYATLTDLDCMHTHRRAAMWLEEIGEPDPAVLGEHYDRGRVSERAARFFHRAAAQALQRNDFDRAHAHAERALRLGPDAPTEAALRAIEAELLFWRGDFRTAAERAPSAVLRLDRGAAEWFGAISVAVGALGQLGRNDEVATLLRDAAKVETAPASLGAHVVALCRGMTQLFWAHEGAGLEDVRACLDALVERARGGLDAYPRGWVHRVRGESAWLHERDIGKCLTELDASCAAFEEARALRPLCLSRLNAASLSGWSGDWTRGLALVASARADAERLGAGFLVSYGRAVEGLLLAYARDPAGEAVMRRAKVEMASNPRLSFICHAVLASAALDRGDLDGAHKEVTQANALRVVDDLRAAGLALASRVATARGAHDEAFRLATEAGPIASRCADLELTHGMSDLALAEAYVARGDRDAARAALAPAVRAIEAIARTITAADQRRRYVERPLANDRIARLARELGVS